MWSAETSSPLKRRPGFPSGTLSAEQRLIRFKDYEDLSVMADQHPIGLDKERGRLTLFSFHFKR